MMKGKSTKLLLFGIGFVTVSQLAACAQTQTQKQSSDETVKTEKVEKEARPSIDDVKLRDKDTLYKDNKQSVVTMYLTVRRGNTSENTNHSWEEINSYSAMDYEKMGVKRYQVAGLLQVGNDDGPVAGELGFGEVVPNATVQIRGQSSSAGKQKSYKIKLKKNKGTWEGQRTIALNKHVYEGMRFRNKMMFDMMSSVPEIMSLRTQFVHLYVKDETGDGEGEKFRDYGLYTQVEQMNSTALEAHGLDPNGHLYKINDFEFYRYKDQIMMEDDPKFKQAEFEKLLEIKGDHNHKKLINFLDRVNDPSVSAEDILDKDIDGENLAYWMAFQILVGNYDTQNRNMFLYSPQSSNRFYFLPWDEDASFTKTEKSMRASAYDRSKSFEIGISNYWGNQLFQKLLKSPSYRKLLDKAMTDLRGRFTKEKVNEEMHTYAEVIRPFIHRMPDEQYARLKGDEYEKVLNALPAEVDQNYKDYQETLLKPQPFFIGVPKEENGKAVINWGAAYDFKKEKVTYDVQVARDYEFKDLIVDKKDQRELFVTTDKLPKGQYFVRVMAKNQSGHTQYAFDRYRTERAVIYGVKSFYVLEDGRMSEDNYDK